MSEKIYRVQMNNKGMPNFSTAEEIIRCEECMFADEEPIADGRYWCALHQCFMRFCSDGKEESR